MEFNGTFLASIISFLVFVYLMNKILYEPMAKIVEARKIFIDDNYSSADNNYQRADELTTQHDEKISDVRIEAKNKHNISVNEYKAQKSDIIQKAQEENDRELDNMRQELTNLSNETKEGLKGKMTDLANSIVEKVLGYRSEVQGFDDETVNRVLYH